MRLIDADALNAAFEPDHDCDWYTPSIIETINEQPTVDAVPVVRGEWVKKIYGWSCSECSESFGPELYYECGYKKPNFCPNCGVDMRGKKT